MNTAIGWLGSVLLMWCGLPMILTVAPLPRADRVFCWIWLAGEVCLLIYVLSGTWSAPLFANYFVNSVLVTCILWRRRHRGP